LKHNGPVNDTPLLDIVGGSVNNYNSKEANNPMMQTHDSDGQSFKSVFNNNVGKMSSRLSGKSGWAGPGHTQGTHP